MKVNYCPQCGGEVISHYKTHIVMASFNEFYCKECFLAFSIDSSDIPEEVLIALGYCAECNTFDNECICEIEEN